VLFGNQTSPMELADIVFVMLLGLTLLAGTMLAN
jgi:hypothetical protein